MEAIRYKLCPYDGNDCNTLMCEDDSCAFLTLKRVEREYIMSKVPHNNDETIGE